MDKIKLSDIEYKTLISTLECGISAYQDTEPNEDGEGGTMVLCFNENGEIERPNIEEKIAILKGIINRIEIV